MTNENEVEFYDDLESQAQIKHNLETAVTDYLDYYGVGEFKKAMNKTLGDVLGVNINFEVVYKGKQNG